MKKGYVLESINSFVVSVLLMPKKDGPQRICVDNLTLVPKKDGPQRIYVDNRYQHSTISHSIPRLDDKLNESYGSWFLYFNHYIVSAAIEASSFINKKSQWQVNRWERTKSQKLLKKKKKRCHSAKDAFFSYFHQDHLKSM